MHKLKKFYCRSFQTIFKLALPLLPYRKPQIIGSVREIPEVVRGCGCSRVLIVTDTTVRSLHCTPPQNTKANERHFKSTEEAPPFNRYPYNCQHRK